MSSRVHVIPYARKRDDLRHQDKEGGSDQEKIGPCIRCDLSDLIEDAWFKRLNKQPR
jgi:hypothetical protein